MRSIALLLSLLGPAAAPASADTLDDARGNMETLVRTFIGDHSRGGWWTLKDKKSGGLLRLKLESFEPDTIRPLKGSLVAGLAVLKEAGGGRRYADFQADFGMLWSIRGMRLISEDAAGRLRQRSRLAAAEEARRQEERAKHRQGPEGSVPDVSLPTLAGGSASPADCEGKKCVVVYVAPWCPHCQAATNDILEMRSLLKPRGIGVHVIVGMDDDDKVASYAEKFGPDTMLDPQKTAPTGNGVPNFSVIDDGGGVSLRRAGAPEGQGGRVLAEYLGL